MKTFFKFLLVVFLMTVPKLVEIGVGPVNIKLFPSEVCVPFDKNIGKKPR